MTKYVTKLDPEHKYYKPVILTSPGIGKEFVNSFNARNNKFKGAETKETYTTNQGFEINLNVYWRTSYSQKKKKNNYG